MQISRIIALFLKPLAHLLRAALPGELVPGSAFVYRPRYDGYRNIIIFKEPWSVSEI